MEKFCLKWNDFQANVASSFKKLKDEKDFFDVTLVTEDDQFVSAHKVVLSASSEFFKNILRKADHSKPMIYLNGVDFKMLSQVIDYIYEGETNIFQEDLDNFLGIAQMLKIEGLFDYLAIWQKLEPENSANNLDEVDYEQTDLFPMEDSQDDIKDAKIRNKKAIVKTVQRSESAVYEEARKAVDKIVMKVGTYWACKTCGKTAQRSSEIRRHAEKHIDGLSFPCNDCGKFFRSRKKLNTHKNYKKTCSPVHVVL